METGSSHRVSSRAASEGGFLPDLAQGETENQALLRQLRDLSVLQAVSEAVLKAGSLDECLHDVVRVITNLLRLDSLGIFLSDAAARRFVLHPSYFLRDTVPVELERQWNWKKIGDEPFLVYDTAQESLPVFLHPGARSLLCVPLKAREGWVGLLCAESLQPGRFNQDDLRLFSIIAGTLLTAIDRLRLLEGEREQRRRAEALQKALSSLRTTLEMPALLNLVLTSLKQLVAYDSASILFWRDNAFEIVASQGLPEGFFAAPVRFGMTKKWEKILLTKSALVYADVSLEPDFEAIPGTEYIRSWMGVPLFTQGDVFGCICLDSRKAGFFTEEHARLVAAFAEHVSLAIEKAQLFEAEQKRRREAETLQQAAAALAFSLNPEEAIQIILDQLAQVVPYDSASVQELKGGYLEIIGGRGWTHPEAVIGLRFPVPGNNPNTIVVQTRQPFVLGNAPAEYTVFRTGIHTHIRSWLGVPLIVRERLIGLLTIDSTQPDYFTEDKIRLAVSFANQAAVALENARLYRRAVKDNERHLALHRASQAIVRAGQDLEDLYEAVRQAAEQLMPLDAFVIALQDEHEAEMVHLVYLYDAGQRWPGFKSPLSESIAGRVILARESQIFSDVSDEKMGSQLIRFGSSNRVRSILAVPMRLAERVIGMISAQSYQPDAYGEEDQRLLEMLAAYAAAAIENVRLYQRLEERLAEAELLNRIAAIVSETRSASDIVSHILEEIQRFWQATSVAGWLFDVNRHNLQLVSSRGWLGRIGDLMDLGSNNVVNWAFHTGEILMCQDLREEKHFPVSWHDLLPEGQGLVCLPVRALGETIGVLSFSLKTPRNLLPTELKVLKAISEMAGNAIRRSQLDEQTQRQLQRLASLRVIDMAINTILDLKVILNVLLEHTLSQLGADAACVLLLNTKTQILTHAASVGFRSEGVTAWQSHVGGDIASKAIRSRSLLFIPDLRETTRAGRLTTLLLDQFVSYACMPLVAKGEVKGVLELYYRSRLEPTGDWKNFLEIVSEQTALAIDNALLFEELQKRNADLSLAYDAAIEVWSKVMDLRGNEVEGHARRLAELTVKVAAAMGIPEADLAQIRRGALLHDVGMMSVPDQILNKPGPLTEEEWEIVRQHPRKAYELLSPIPQLRVALDIPYCHHERWNGSGYPRGISGKQIPLAARIFAVVDVWDALLSDRPYRKAWSREAALQYIQEQSGILFDPAVVEAFLKVVSSLSARPV